MVGGDLYDFLELLPGRLGVVVADVSGKGVPAAIVMAHASAALRSLAPQLQDDLAEVMSRINTLLLSATASQHYVTLFLGVYDEGRRSLRYVNCGHPPPILLRATGEVVWLAPTGPAVGLLPAFAAHEGVTALDAGDALLAYSDGVTETVGREGDELGAERLLAAFRQHAGADPDSLVTRLLDGRRAFAAGAERDDVTVLVAQGY
jgi:sigma-B regulation protein RsbU (phosphoserine phosphatase)